jgi:hypothetical protein
MASCYCKWCGQKYSDPRALSINSCRQNSEGNKHAIYEGGEKKAYCCKYYGRKFNDMRNLCINSCKESPSGHHSPAL